ncbi:hypothetical protein EG352_06605 [Chryseobacterium indologenes]|jgi:hypothetical protein|uniref:Uncharacterized protein n=1 Tax=Chryseobacterium indologenes TaxID=253 RepID=A0AAD1DVQ3_CHRID|nr:hypothetical protein [Chryseobacterium indologenes]AZB17457.1 hypothetical protein EG352_06605 [Chryseobacterium indologenes]
MKSLRITLGVAAIALGTFTAFSFAPAKADQDTGIFYRNADGSMGDPYNPSLHPCAGASPVCAQEYDLETELPTGQNQIPGVKQ